MGLEVNNFDRRVECDLAQARLNFRVRDGRASAMTESKLSRMTQLLKYRLSDNAGAVRDAMLPQPPRDT